MPDGREFIPPADQDGGVSMTDDEIFPEDLVFDKAERAESLGRMRHVLDERSGKLESLEARLRDSQAETERSQLERRILKVKEIRERLSRRIEKAEAAEH